jgi:uncharacterized protein (DUF362 family)/Pyruvate/2-oxoacid:ferredoxin oxidoreductase delta subunit
LGRSRTAKKDAPDNPRSVSIAGLSPLTKSPVSPPQPWQRREHQRRINLVSNWQRSHMGQSVVSTVTCDSYNNQQVFEAVREVLAVVGGLSAFVSPGDTVLVKPNLLTPSLPEKTITTHPSILRAVITLLHELDCRIWVGDSPAGSHPEDELWEKTGVQAVVRELGGELKSFKGPVMPLPCGSSFVPVPAWFKDVDKIISLPKLKTHLLTTITCALKNVYGVVAGNSKSLYHASFPSPQAMSEFLVDVYAAIRPTLSLVDAVDIMEGDGPAAGKTMHLGLIIAGTDAVAIDAVCSRVFGLQPKDVPMISIASRCNLGQADINNIEIIGSGANKLQGHKFRLSHGRVLNWLPESFFSFTAFAAKIRPQIYQHECIQCGLCSEICSQHAISKNRRGELAINYDLCIACMCCMETCKKQAIHVRSRFEPVRRMISLSLRMLRKVFPRK